MPIVSVLIPAYRPTYLRQAIASVLAQTYQDYELLISDDCATDAVRSVVDEFRDRRIRLLQGPRQGLVANSAFLFDQAGGDLLKFVYDDDFLLPFAIARLAEAMEAAPSACFAFAARHIVAADGRIGLSPQTVEPGPARLIRGQKVVASMLSVLKNHIGEPTSTLVRRSLVEGGDSLRMFAGYPIRHLIDVGFYLNALQRGPCIGVPEFHAAFRKHPEQTSAQLNPVLSIGFFEWELFIRGEVASGRCPADAALTGLRRLGPAYLERVDRYPELGLFAQGLPALVERIERGDDDLLDDGFRRTWDEADRVIAARLANPPSA